MDLGLTDARALIGGGSGGLGGAIAQALRDEGARTGLIGRPGEKLQAAAERLGSVAVPADLATPDGPRQAVEAAVAAFGGLDLLVVNSGGPPPGRFDELDEATWQAAIDGTLWSAIRLLRAALPHLREGRDPAILVVLSSSAREPIPGLTTSNLIRPGLAGLIKSLVEEIVPVRINGLAPGRLADGPDRGDRCRAGGVQQHRRSRRSSAAHDRAHPARTLRRPARVGARGRVPAVARRVLRHGRDRAGRWRDDPGAAVRGPLSGTRTRGSST